MPVLLGMGIFNLKFVLKDTYSMSSMLKRHFEVKQNSLDANKRLLKLAQTVNDLRLMDLTYLYLQLLLLRPAVAY